MARKLIEGLSKPAVYYDLELAEDFETLSQNTTWLLENNIDKTIVIDEVQRHLPLFPQLRALIDRKREPGRFILLGSAEDFPTRCLHPTTVTGINGSRISLKRMSNRICRQWELPPPFHCLTISCEWYHTCTARCLTIRH
ncbi:AAA family ATPase [Dyadobacter sp. 50-39]|uniref:AAA family ATPase n=1 Tax=Dyadobacter sp. 50-39 TaxID=1895756 RepID=UPI0025C1B38A|nr:AAA family ATPase [Dyadobacter sp. 50-39]